MSLTFDELRKANDDRQKAYPTHVEFDTRYWLIALTGELGELCNYVKKQDRDGKDYTVEITKELADVQTYLDLLASHLGVNLGEATRAKFNEVSERIKSDIKL